MRHLFWALALCGACLLTDPAHAVTCANGVYRAGCAGPNGAVVGRKQPYPYSAHPYYRPPGQVSCANGVYRAGCVTPHGAAVVRKPY